MEMRQKVVIKVSFDSEKKSRTKVVQAAVGVPVEEEEKITEPRVQPMVWPTYQPGVPQYYYHTVVPDTCRNETCSIM